MKGGGCEAADLQETALTTSIKPTLAAARANRVGESIVLIEIAMRPVGREVYINA